MDFQLHLGPSPLWLGLLVGLPRRLGGNDQIDQKIVEADGANRGILTDSAVSNFKRRTWKTCYLEL